jgi:hypothetical protein
MVIQNFLFTKEVIAIDLIKRKNAFLAGAGGPGTFENHNKMDFIHIHDGYPSIVVETLNNQKAIAMLIHPAFNVKIDINTGFTDIQIRNIDLVAIRRGHLMGFIC